MRPFRFGALGALLLTALFAACDSGEGSSLYDPDATGDAAPTVAAITPTGIVLAGVDVVTIEGANFSPVPAENIVYFDDGQGNSARGQIQEASATRLVVKTPNLPNPALKVRVAVVGARDFSNSVALPLTAASRLFGDLAQNEDPFGIATGPDGAVYVSLFNDGSSAGIQRIAPDGTRSPYFTTTFSWADLALANGTLVGVRRIRAIFTLPEGGSQAVLAAFQPSTTALNAVATRPDGTVYTPGNSGVIYRINPDRSTAEAPFAPTVRGLAIAGNTLYAVGQEGSQSRVWRLPLAADGAIGAAEAVADLPGAARSIAVAEDGTLFVGTEAVQDPIVTVSPSGEVATLYPGVLTGPAIGLEFGAGTKLYMVRGSRDAGDGTNILGRLVEIEARVAGAR